MSGRSSVWTQAAYRSSSSLEIRIFSPSTSISLLSTQLGSAGEREREDEAITQGDHTRARERVFCVLMRVHMYFDMHCACLQHKHTHTTHTVSHVFVCACEFVFVFCLFPVTQY